MGGGAGVDQMQACHEFLFLCVLLLLLLFSTKPREIFQFSRSFTFWGFVMMPLVLTVEGFFFPSLITVKWADCFFIVVDAYVDVAVLCLLFANRFLTIKSEAFFRADIKMCLT